MIIINLQKIEEFIREHADSEASLRTWQRIATTAAWKNPAEMRQARKDADLYGCCWIFNISRNKYRLIAEINYRAQVITIKYVLTHADYDKDKWKKDCEA